MNTKDIEGFTFKLAGDFYINPIKSVKKYKWCDENKNDKHDHISLCINFIEEGLDEKEELAYIITVDEEVVYVGEFSKSLRQRWLKIDNYIWHHKDHEIYKILDENNKKENNKRKVSLWLIVDPFVCSSSDMEINISKSIEHHILKNKEIKWNIRNNSTLASR